MTSFRLWRFALIGTAWLALLGEGVSRADVVYPASFLMNELEPGRYDVVFTLPVLEGLKLRAEPLLPPTCRDATERAVDATPSSFRVSWQVLCEPASLAGEAVLIEGLLGTQTELRVEISTLDGRRHTALLKPSRPGFIVPPPPPSAELVLGSTLAGMRRVLQVPALWLLVLVAVFAGTAMGSGRGGILGFAVGHALAQWLAARNGLLVSAHLGSAFALATGLVPALGLTRGEAAGRSWVRPLWAAGALLGAVFGGVRADPVATEGLSRSELVAASLFFGLGVALGLALLAAIAAEIRHLAMTHDSSRWRIRVGYVTGTLAVALLVPRLAALFVLPTDLPAAPFELALLAVLLGTALPILGIGGRSATAIGFALAVGSGIALGFVASDPPSGRLVVLGSLFLFGVLLFVAKPIPSRYLAPLAAIAAVGHGWNTGRVLDENVSLPVATAAGAGLVAVCLFYASLRMSQISAPGKERPAARFLGAAIAVLAVVWRTGEYLRWIDGELATEAALGRVRIPFLALTLLLVAFFLWPRRRRVLKELGVERRASKAHWAVVGLAFFLLPVGTLLAKNPMFEPEAPRGDDARRILSQVLWNTYHAFNLDDEDELYDRLSESVTEDLVADLYLDSRRRLTAGTREGAEVTVRDVSVVEVADAVSGSTPESGFVYDCQWVVTARVRHLQHVHHRQNIYSGKLVLRVDGDRWKIANVELTSEDRVVLPWNPS